MIFFIFAGYKNHTLYAEAETRFFSTTNSNGSNLMDDDLYIHLEEAKIFLTIDGIKKYFKVNTTIELVQTTTDINEASIFTLNTTPEDHKVGNFFIQYTTSDQENTSLESFTTYDLIMKLTDRTIGPYHLALCKHGDSCNGIYFDLLGHGSSLPRFDPQ